MCYVYPSHVSSHYPSTGSTVLPGMNVHSGYNNTLARRVSLTLGLLGGDGPGKSSPAMTETKIDAMKPMLNLCE